jgi:hypothetical protein
MHQSIGKKEKLDEEGWGTSEENIPFAVKKMPRIIGALFPLACNS